MSHTKVAPSVPPIAGKTPPEEGADRRVRLVQAGRKPVDEDVDADMDAGAHAIGRAELRHPHEHVDAKLLRPGDVKLDEIRIEKWHPGAVAMHDSDEDNNRRSRHQAGDQGFLEAVEDAEEYAAHG